MSAYGDCMGKVIYCWNLLWHSCQLKHIFIVWCHCWHSNSIFAWHICHIERKLCDVIIGLFIHLFLMSSCTYINVIMTVITYSLLIDIIDNFDLSKLHQVREYKRGMCMNAISIELYSPECATSVLIIYTMTKRLLALFFGQLLGF